jgi:hypothetical protein
VIANIKLDELHDFADRLVEFLVCTVAQT